MSTLWSRIKTEQSAQSSPFKNLFSISQKQLSRAQSRLKSQGTTTKIQSERSSLYKRPQDRLVKQQNIRLISKLMEISHRKIKPIFNQPPIIKKRQNPQRQRQIMQENQRLGRSIIKIKSGKSVERIKIQIAKNIAKMQRKKRKLLQQKMQGTRTVTEGNDYPPQEYNEILQLSKTHNLSSSKRLSRASNIRGTQLSDLKKTII